MEEHEAQTAGHGKDGVERRVLMSEISFQIMTAMGSKDREEASDIEKGRNIGVMASLAMVEGDASNDDSDADEQAVNGRRAEESEAERA